jgi:hypothetical protein
MQGRIGFVCLVDDGISYVGRGAVREASLRNEFIAHEAPDPVADGFPQGSLRLGSNFVVVAGHCQLTIEVFGKRPVGWASFD